MCCVHTHDATGHNIAKRRIKCQHPHDTWYSTTATMGTITECNEFRSKTPSCIGPLGLRSTCPFTAPRFRSKTKTKLEQQETLQNNRLPDAKKLHGRSESRTPYN
eukprot:2679314-Amphidinium_carterae.1